MRNSGLNKALALARWERQLEGCIRFLENLSRADVPLTVDANLWRAGMRAHYMRQAALLMDRAPPGSAPAVKGFTRRLAKV